MVDSEPVGARPALGPTPVTSFQLNPSLKYSRSLSAGAEDSTT